MILDFHKTCKIEIEAWRARALAAETTVKLITEILTRERDARQKLEESLIPKTHNSQRPPEMNPVGTSVSSWPRIRRELEKQNRVKDAGVSREEIEKTLWRQE